MPVVALTTSYRRKRAEDSKTEMAVGIISALSFERERLAGKPKGAFHPGRDLLQIVFPYVSCNSSQRRAAKVAADLEVFNILITILAQRQSTLKRILSK